MWVTFHLDRIIRMWETLPLLKGKCQVLTVFLEAKWFEFPDSSMGTLCLSLPFIWLNGSFTSGYADITGQGRIPGPKNIGAF